MQRKTYDIVTADVAYGGKPTRHSKLDVQIAAEFRRQPEAMHEKAVAIRSALESKRVLTELTASPDNDDDFEQEGGVLERLVARRERSRKLRKRKLRAVREAGGDIACEVCRFDFAFVYGDRGSGYIEVHHLRPLHVSGETQTSLADLALLCANCHRMCHRTPYLAPAELAALVRATTVVGG